MWEGIKRKVKMKEKFESFYYKYQEYLYRNNFYLKSDLFAPITTKIIIYHPPSDMPIINSDGKLEHVPGHYSVMTYPLLEMLKQPISSEYRDEILSWVIWG